MNFSGIYTEEEFEEETSWLDVSHIHGTNCYCDGEAFGELLGCIDGYPAGGIHFIDSGNYHYMSRIWLEKVDEPVTLVVFDNHTDMQPPAFGGLLSCGGWIAEALTENPWIRKAVLVGPDEEAFAQTEPELREKVEFLSKEKMRFIFPLIKIFSVRGRQTPPGVRERRSFRSFWKWWKQFFGVERQLEKQFSVWIFAERAKAVPETIRKKIKRQTER